MTIKELENRTGMTRANIRFYEGEGLLSPKRLDNGYRDYSEEDARTLEKIKLLRQLQLDIDTIRKVQQGTLTLEQALFVQTTRLEGDKALIERAAEVCRELERSGIEYAALEPRPYLQRLEPPQQTELPPPPPRPVVPERDDTPRACYHPWQRWFARMLDVTLYTTVFDALLLFLARQPGIVLAGGILGWVLGLLGLAFALAAEPLWLHFWGWTPGKWVFGLKLRNAEDETLTLAQGFQRSAVIIWDGYGLNIPFYNLWRFWKCREMGLEGRDCSWDGENDYRYTKEERRVHPAVIFIAVTAVCFAAQFAGLKYTETPPNQGPLTVEQFAENYNYYFRQLIDQSSTALPGLDKEGRWDEHETPYGTIVIDLSDTTWDEPELTVEDGRVTAVTLRWVSEDNVLAPGGTRETLALLALSGSAEGTDLFLYNLPGWLKAAEAFQRWEDCETDHRSLHIRQRVEYAGYDGSGEYLIALDGEEHRCEKTVTISLME